MNTREFMRGLTAGLAPPPAPEPAALIAALTPADPDSSR
jgi:hypothetical protein